MSENSLKHGAITGNIVIEMQKDNKPLYWIKHATRRHVSALFYGAIFRSIMVTKEETEKFPWGVLYIVGRLWTLKTCNIG